MCVCSLGVQKGIILAKVYSKVDYAQTGSQVCFRVARKASMLLGFHFSWVYLYCPTQHMCISIAWSLEVSALVAAWFEFLLVVAQRELHARRWDDTWRGGLHCLLAPVFWPSDREFWRWGLALSWRGFVKWVFAASRLAKVGSRVFRDLSLRECPRQEARQ